jgi:glycosyltransferase involved in cell wall biosynthesis
MPVWSDRQRAAASAPLNILCPTYWYPEHATDIHATYVHDINRHLVRRGHRVRVVTPGSPRQAAREEFDGVEVVRFPLVLSEDLQYGQVAQGGAGSWQKVRRLLTMSRYLLAQYSWAIREGRELPADIVHAHWAIPTGPAAVSAARNLGVPSVITMHGGDVYVNREQGYDFPTRWYVRPVLRWTLSNATALTAITDDCRQHALRAGASQEKTNIVLNGADLERFSPAKESPGGREFGEQMVFACRQLFPRKGIRFLIEAVARLADEFPALRLVIAGDGFERPELERLAAGLGIGNRTTFLGWVPNAELPRYYRAAAVSVIPSLEEGFGIPAAEAMGCEVPVIASDAGGLPEVVLDGVTGSIVPKGDSEALAAALRHLLNDPELCRRYGKAGRKIALQRFSWDISAQHFEQLYLRCLHADELPARATEGAN